MTNPGFLSLTIIRGTTATQEWNWTDDSIPPNTINLSGYTFTLNFYDVNTPTGTPLLAIQSNGTNPQITLQNISPNIQWSLTTTQTSSFTVDVLFYQLIYTDPSTNVECLLDGKIYLKPRVN